MGAARKVLIIIAFCTALVASAKIGYALFPYVSAETGIDTVAPMAEVANWEIWAGDQLTADQFVQNVEDATDITITYSKEPDFTKVGQQEVYIALKDSRGNKRVLTAQLTIKADTEPPVILGAKNQTVYVGAKVAYRKDITVVDNRDEQVPLVVDSSAVNIKKPGKYPVIYTATDEAGNTTSVTVEFTVIAKPKNYTLTEEVFARADQVLANILQEGMTEVDKAWAIYTWVTEHLSFVGTSDKSDWVQAAARGFNRGTGDCFVYYALSRALLTRAGFENMCVEKSASAGPPRHYWNLVKVNGNWYHFDTCPNYTGYSYTCFLRTDVEVREYSEWCRDYYSCYLETDAEVRECTRWCENYYAFDADKYPATPLEPLDIEQHR